MTGPDLPQFMCGCGYRGSVFQVSAHKGRRKNNAKYPQCQGPYIPVTAGPPEAEPGAQAQAEAEERAYYGEAIPPESEAGGVEWPQDQVVEVTGEQPAANGSKPAASGAVFTYKESVTVSPVLRTLWNTLRVEERLDMDFPAFLEQSCLRYWRSLGYEVAVVIRSPQGRLAPVGAGGNGTTAPVNGTPVGAG